MEALDPKFSLSVVIPVYNEEACLPQLERELCEVLPFLGRPFEVIMVNDGSTDRSPDLIREICGRRSEFRAVHFARNSGSSAAMAAGFGAARGAVIVTIDADLQNDPKDIPLLLEKIGEYDCVCGWRQKRHDSLLRLVSSKIANGVRNRLSGETIKDIACGLKAYRTDAVRKIRMFHGAHRFIPTLLKMEGAKVTEVPINHRPRTMGKAKYGLWNRVFCSSRDLLGVRWLKSRVFHYEITSESGKGLPEEEE